MASGNTDRTVLVAVDESPNARNAFDWFLSNVKRPNDLVIVSHVPEMPNLPLLSLKGTGGMNVPVEEWTSILSEQKNKLDKLQTDYEMDLISKKINHKMCFEQVSGKPGSVIINLAEREKADVIVVGTRGLSAVKRTLMGSVSDYIVHHSAVPVIVCPNE